MSSKRLKNKRKSEVEIVSKEYEEFDPKTAASFDDFPLSEGTQIGLRNSGFSVPTDIQRESIGFGLRGCDVLGAAMTGSGKTLAFLIPVLEMLWRNKWSRFDGIGALIISPTRELAMQIYEVLRKVGSQHDFSAALIVGGTDVSYESKRLAGKNIVVCTPGRLLQHMDENPNFSCDSLKMLVIDEADRILDMGFERQMNAVISNLPVERQTLLFSATQTRSVKDLARLSLKDPVYVSVHEHAKYSTPEQLRQSYVVCEEEDKLNMLWSFIKNHQHSKVLAFMSNCKQVRFAFDAFRRLRPRTTLLCLHGSMPQMKRVNVYQQFCNKHHVVLLATDLAARGLDFPAVDWVLQLDCPSDSNEYIHRSGRTARYERDGESLLVLTPSQETSMVADLKSKKIPISKITINPVKLTNIQKKLETFCTQDPKLKVSAQKAFVAYIRSVFLMRNKAIFDVKQINYEALARSYGLAVTPRIRFLRKQSCGEGSAYSKPPNPVNDVDDDSTDSPAKQEEDNAILEIKAKGNTKELSGWVDRDDDQAEDLFTVKRHDGSSMVDDWEDAETEAKPKPRSSPERTLSSAQKKPLTRAAIAKKILKKKIVANKKTVFGDDGEVRDANAKISKDGGEQVDVNDDGYRIEVAKEIMKVEDKIDFQNYRRRIREKHKEGKRKRKEAEMEKRRGKQKALGAAVLGDPDEDDTNSEDGGDSSDGETSMEWDEEEVEHKASAKRKKLRLNRSPSDEETLRVQQDCLDLDLANAEKLALRLLDSK